MIKSNKEKISVESTIASALWSEGDHAEYDAACKRLLAEKSILAWILKDCVSEYRDIPVQKIADYIEGKPQISEIPVMPGETWVPAPEKGNLLLQPHDILSVWRRV